MAQPLASARRGWLLVAACCVALSTPASAREVTEPEAVLPSITVLRFDNPLANEWWSVEGMRRAQDLLLEELSAVGRYAVVDRATLESRMQVAKLLQPPGRLSPAGAVKLGRILGLRFLVTGSLTDFGAGEKAGRRRLLGLRSGRDFAAALTLRVLDGTSGRLVWADSAQDAAAFDERWATADSGAVEAEMFDRLLQPMLRGLAARLLEADLTAVTEPPED